MNQKINKCKEKVSISHFLKETRRRRRGTRRGRRSWNGYDVIFSTLTLKE
jgi:hypothetical protein